MPMAVPIVMAAAAIGGAIMGGIASSKARAQAKAAMDAALGEINAVGAPPDLSARIIYEKFAQAGILTPEIESQILTFPSKVGQIAEDQQLRGTQIGALNMLKQQAKTGLRPEDRAAFNKLRAETQRDLNAKNQQIMQNMQARGIGGAGAELAAQLQAAQSGADRASAEGDSISAEASKRALEALGQSANLAGGIRAQDFGINKDKAAAQDEFERFNVGNQINRQSRNVDRSNIANAANLGEKQRIQDTNTNVENTERLREVEAKRQYWQDKLNYATAKANAMTGQAGMIMQGGQQQANMWQGIGSGISSAAGAYGAYSSKQPSQGAQYAASEDAYDRDMRARGK